MDLYAFLHPIELKEESEVVISKRFRDENGNVVPFKIKAISQEENDLITKKSRRAEKTNGFVQEIFDPVEYNKRLIVAATVFRILQTLRFVKDTERWTHWKFPDVCSKRESILRCLAQSPNYRVLTTALRKKMKK